MGIAESQSAKALLAIANGFACSSPLALCESAEVIAEMRGIPVLPVCHMTG